MHLLILALDIMHKYLVPGGWLTGTVPAPGYSHHEDDPTVNFIDQIELQSYLCNIGFDFWFVTPSPSVNKEDKVYPCIYFKAQKRGNNE